MSSRSTDNFRVRRYVVAKGDDPVAVRAPIACNYVGWSNVGDFLVALTTLPHSAATATGFGVTITGYTGP
jgi:hypothetical protein